MMDQSSTNCGSALLQFPLLSSQVRYIWNTNVINSLEIKHSPLYYRIFVLVSISFWALKIHSKDGDRSSAIKLENECRLTYLGSQPVFLANTCAISHSSRGPGWSGSLARVVNSLGSDNARWWRRNTCWCCLLRENKLPRPDTINNF